MPRNEADIRILLIGPKLRAAGRSSTRVTREHCCRRDQAYTTGHIYLRGDRARRGKPLCSTPTRRAHCRREIDQAILRQVDFVLLAGNPFEKHTVDPLAMYVAVEGLRRPRDATFPLWSSTVTLGKCD